jgi:hypothetical protein
MDAKGRRSVEVLLMTVPNFPSQGHDKILSAKLPTMETSLEGSYSRIFRLTHGGKLGKPCWHFEWSFRNDTKAKLKFNSHSAESLVNDNWNATIKSFYMLGFRRRFHPRYDTSFVLPSYNWIFMPVCLG